MVEVYYEWGASWSNWYSLGGRLASGTKPAVASWSAGRLDVFVQGTDGALWHKWSTNGGTQWSNWGSLGGKLGSGPAVVSPFTVGAIDFFVRGTDGAAWQKTYNHGWSSWKSIGGQVASGTAPAMSQTLWLIVQGTDHQLWQKNVGSSGAAWKFPGAALPQTLSTASPGAVCTVANEHTLICFSSTSGNIWYGIHDSGGRIDGCTNLGSHYISASIHGIFYYISASIHGFCCYNSGSFSRSRRHFWWSNRTLTSNFPDHCFKRRPRCDKLFIRDDVRNAFLHALKPPFQRTRRVLCPIRAFR